MITWQVCCKNKGLTASNILARCLFRSTYNKYVHPVIWATLHSRSHIRPLPHLSLILGITPRDYVKHIARLSVLVMNIWWINKGDLHTQLHEQYTNAASNMYLYCYLQSPAESRWANSSLMTFPVSPECICDMKNTAAYRQHHQTRRCQDQDYVKWEQLSTM